MSIRTIKLRVPCDDTILGINLDTSLHEVEATVEDGVLTIQAGTKVWDALRRSGRTLNSQVKSRQPVVKTVDELAKPVRKAVEKAAKTEASVEDSVAAAIFEEMRA